LQRTLVGTAARVAAPAAMTAATLILLQQIGKQNSNSASSG
jgi:hypothetical protein